MILLEGGNEFKSDAGQSVTKQNASTEEAQAVVKLMQKELGINLMPYVAGSVIYPDAETGDADVILDPTNYVKVNTEKSNKEIMNDFRVWLAQRLQKAGYQELPKKATVPSMNKYYKIAGDGLTAMAPIPGTNEWFQIDLDISEPGEGAFSVWSKRGEPNKAGTPKDQRAKGAFRHILLTTIATAKDPNWMWSYKAGLADRTTKQTISKDPGKVAQALFGPNGNAKDLDNIQTILQKLKLTYPEQYNNIIQKVNDGLTKYNTQYRLQESLQEGSNEWFRTVLDKLK